MRIDNKSNIRLKSNIMIQSKIKSKTREHFMPAELIVDLFPYKKDIRYQYLFHDGFTQVQKDELAWLITRPRDIIDDDK